MGKIRELVRSVDAFATPVVLTYKREIEFDTAVGGCITILIGLLSAGYLAQQVVAISGNPTFAYSNTCDYSSYFASNESYTLNTT